MKIKVDWDIDKTKEVKLPKVVGLPENIWKQYWETGDTNVIPDYLLELFGIESLAWYPIQEGR